MAEEGLYRKVQLLLDAESARRVEQEAHRALSKGTSPKEAVRNLEEVEKGASKLGGFFSRLGLVIGAAFAVQKIRQFASEMFALGSASEETASKFETTFGSTSRGVDEFLKSWGRLAGLNETLGRDFASTAGAIGQGMGLTTEASADLSEQVLRLAGDLTSFKNIPLDQTFRAVIGGITGEREALKTLGIVVSEAEVQQRVLVESGKARASQLTQEDKALAALSIMYDKAGVAVGDLERTQNSTANTARRLKGEFEDVRTDIAKKFMPTAAALVGMLAENKDSIKETALGAADALVEILNVLGRIASFTASAIEVVINVKTKVNNVERDLHEYFQSIGWIRRTNERLLEGAGLTPQQREAFGEMGVNVPEAPASVFRLPGTKAGPPRRSTPEAPPPPPTPEEVEFAQKMLAKRVDAMLEAAARAVEGHNYGAFGQGDSPLVDMSGRAVIDRAPARPSGIIQSVQPQSGPGGVISEVELTEFQRIMDAMQLSVEDTTAMMTGAFEGFFDSLFSGFKEGEGVFESFAEATAGLGRAMIASMTEGAAQWQMAEGAADLAGGSWPPNPVQLAAASLHFAAAGAFRALGELIGSGGGSYMPSAGGPSAGSSIAQMPMTSPIQVYVSVDPIDQNNPVHAKTIGGSMDLSVHLGGRPAWARPDWRSPR